MTQGGPQWDTEYDKGYAAGKLAAAVDSHYYPDRWKEQVAALLHHDSQSDTNTAPTDQLTFIRYESWEDPYIAAGMEPSRPEEITQCHCGCARSVHLDRSKECQLCGHCPRYRVRTGPVF